MSEIRSVRDESRRSLIVTTHGYINDQGGQSLRQECEAGLESDLTNIIIDFGESDLINSVAISNIIAVIEKVEERRGSLSFTGLQPTVREVFDMMGLSRHAMIRTSVDDAVEQGNSETPEAL